MKLHDIVRKNILNLDPYISAREINSGGVLLDANENSFGSIIETNGIKLNRYPDPGQTGLRESLSEWLGVPVSKLFLGVGSDEIIDLVIRIFCEPGRSNVIIPQPTYGIYKKAATINDVEVRSVDLEMNFDLNPSTIIKNTDENTRIIFLCSPNNPSGNLLSSSKILFLASVFEGLIFIDEAYIDFLETASIIREISAVKNVIISRTFSKAWGMAGVRCGYCIADEFIISLLFKIKAPYSINTLTAVSVLSALAKRDRLKDVISMIKTERKRLVSELISVRQVEDIYPSVANFILVKFNSSDKIFSQLNDHGIRVRRHADHPLLLNCLRITIGTEAENNFLLKILREAD